MKQVKTPTAEHQRLAESWDHDRPRPELAASGGAVRVQERHLGECCWTVDGDAPLLFSENETNTERLYGVPNRTPYAKDTFHEAVVHGRADAVNLAQRLTRIFLRNAANGGRRPVFGQKPLLQDDPHWRDHVLFYEYFHGDNGAGASHLTGWTALAATLLQDAEQGKKQ